MPFVRLNIEVFFKLVDSFGDGTIAALLFQTFQRRQNAVANKRLLVTKLLDFVILLVLLDYPPVYTEDNSADNADRTYHGGDFNYHFNNFCHIKSFRSM